MDNRILSTEILKVQNQLAGAKIGSEDYNTLLQTLQKLQSIEDNDTKLALDERRADIEDLKVNNEMRRLINEEKKIKSDERRDYIKLGVGTAAGFGAIFLTLVGESEKVIRTKGWQFATRILQKFT